MLPADFLSEAEIAACADVAGGRDDAGTLTEQGLVCLARTVQLNPGLREWYVDVAHGQVDTQLSSERTCCWGGCTLTVDLMSGRPLRAGKYIACP